MTFLLKTLIFFATLFKRKQFRTSQSVEGNSIDFAKGEMMLWGFKHFIRGIEDPELGKGIEEYLKKCPPVFSPPDGFVAENTAVISAAGDIMPDEHMTNNKTAHLWDDVQDFFFPTDLRIANLESPLDPSKECAPPGTNIIKPPAMNTTEEAFDIFWRGGEGINFFSTANNHAMDQGEDGLVNTLEFLDGKKVSYVGTSRTPEEQDNFPILDVQGIRIALLGYTFSLNRQKTPDGKEYMANMLRLNLPDCDISIIKRHIAIAREKNADLIIANLHWSLEYESFPIDNVIDMGHNILEAGVDIILGNHPHTLQPAQRYDWTDKETGREKSGLIMYAQGNVANDLIPQKNSALAALVRFTIQKGTLDGVQQTIVTDTQLLPIIHYLRKENGQVTEVRILGLGKLEKQVSSGQCPYPLTRKQTSEIVRLRRLAGRLMPTAFTGE